jgi:putative ABC transport system permease protein
MLLCGAGLLIRSFLRLQAVDSGFRPEKVLTMRIAASGSEDSYTTFYGQVLERVNALPSVKATGIIEDVMQRRNPDYVINLAGRAAQPSEPVSGDAISPGCFEALGVRLLKGRWFSDQDKGGPPVAIINETMARHFWPGEEVVGKQFREADQKPNHPWYAVVGVVTDMRRQGVERQPIAQIFWPYFQRQSWTMDLVVRTASDPANLASAVRQEIRSLDKNTPVFNVSTLERRLAESLSPQRFQSLLLGVLALLALALAAVGIYGIMRYAVAQRTHELGIRLALGAQVQDVFRLILGQGIRLVLFGMGFGLAGALALARVLRSLLYEVSTSDPLTFAGIAVLLTGVALLACWIPARRATKVDPMVALRSE